MILLGGAGAVAEAARAMRKIQSKVDRQARRTKNRSGSGESRPHVYEEDRTDFPCMQLCGTCGFVIDDESLGEAAETACPACGDEGWFDLADERIANRVRSMEAEERNTAPLSVKIAVVVATVVVLAAVVGGLTAAGYQVAAILVGFSSIAVIPFAYFALPRSASVLLLRGRERTPHRWHVPLPLPDEDEPSNETLAGRTARPVDETIAAPISERECLAYQVCVLFDTSGDARPPEWALQEQRATEIRLGDDLAVGSEEVFLESPVELVEEIDDGLRPDDFDEREADDQRYARVKKFLRQRGLFAGDGEFHFYEARLEPGDAVDVTDYDGEMYVLRHTGAEAAEDHPALPRPSHD